MPKTALGRAYKGMLTSFEAPNDHVAYEAPMIMRVVIAVFALQLAGRDHQPPEWGNDQHYDSKDGRQREIR
jgi:hypothetical protein